MVIVEDLQSKLAAIADNYRAAGYEVILNPTSRDLPPFAAGYQPDLVATRPGDNVLVEVKHSASRSQTELYRELAERVSEHPGWRLDLIVSIPPNELSEAPEYPLLPSGSTRARLDDAERILDSGYPEAALLLAWAATEGLLRSRAAEEDVALPRQNTGSLLTQLTALGAVSRIEYQRLRDAMSQRNAVAHGFAAPGVHEAARDVIDLGRTFLSETGQAA